MKLEVQCMEPNMMAGNFETRRISEWLKDKPNFNGSLLNLNQTNFNKFKTEPSLNGSIPNQLWMVQYQTDFEWFNTKPALNGLRQTNFEWFYIKPILNGSIPNQFWMV